jgi:hypothetical protein
MRLGPESLAQSQPPGTPPPAPRPAPPLVSEDYARRWVAVLYDGTLPLTREELGEYLIARYGAEKLELLVNKRIIEEAAKAQKIMISDSEVDADLATTLEGLSINQTEFVTKVLKAYRKTLYEWKEDVIRPKLMMTKLVQNRVNWTEDDLRKAYNAHYGERVEGRVILWPPEEKKVALMEYSKIRDSEEEFARKAKCQASKQLSASGGKIDKPIGHDTTGSLPLERAVFSLNEGEVTEVLQVPEGWVVFKCDRRLPADTTVNVGSVRDNLIKEIVIKKTQIEIDRAFKDMKEKAKPRLLLTGPGQTQDIGADVRRELPPDLGGTASFGGVPNNR